MKRKLIFNQKELYYLKEGKRIAGNVSDISGNVSGIFGNVSGLSGNIDDCDISQDERKKGVDIKLLIKE